LLDDVKKPDGCDDGTFGLVVNAAQNQAVGGDGHGSDE
jgi:hypothetical protein